MSRQTSGDTEPGRRAGGWAIDGSAGRVLADLPGVSARVAKAEVRDTRPLYATAAGRTDRVEPGRLVIVGHLRIYRGVISPTVRYDRDKTSRKLDPEFAKAYPLRSSSGQQT